MQGVICRYGLGGLSVRHAAIRLLSPIKHGGLVSHAWMPTRRKLGTRQLLTYVGENLWNRISTSISGVWCGTWCIAAIFAHRPAVSKILGEKKIFSVSLARKENIRKISIIKYEDNISQDNKRYRSHMTFSEQPEGGWMCGWWMRMKACPPFCFVNISGRI